MFISFPVSRRNPSVMSDIELVDSGGHGPSRTAKKV